MDTTPPPAPFDHLRFALESSGPAAAVDRLCDHLRGVGDYQSLFYAKLMKARVELGVSPFPSGPAADLPSHTHEKYEDAIRQAGREVGRLYLAKGDIFKAWGFFRMLGEPDAVKAALDAVEPGPDDDTYGLVDIAWQQGVHPTKGFDLVLDRNGICSAITMVGGADLSRNPEVREYCVKRLVRALHAQLTERIKNDFTSRGIHVPEGAVIGQMLAGQEDLFAEDVYHIDTSHLGSVVQMALHLPPCPELALARELCEYGERLSPGLRGDGHPPFEDTYADYKVYLDVIAGRDVEEGIEHFKRKLPAAADEGNTFPAEVLVNLLLKLDRLPEAVAVAKEYLPKADGQELSCPPLTELARRAGDYRTLAEVARTGNDPVTFLAGLIAARG
jgi:hypothetical protein